MNFDCSDSELTIREDFADAHRTVWRMIGEVSPNPQTGTKTLVERV